MTDETEKKSISIQTNLPKTNLAFSLLEETKLPIPSSYNLFVHRMQQNETILSSQMQALNEIDQQIEIMNGNRPDIERHFEIDLGSSFENSRVSEIWFSFRIYRYLLRSIFKLKIFLGQKSPRTNLDILG